MQHNGNVRLHPMSPAPKSCCSIALCSSHKTAAQLDQETLLPAVAAASFAAVVAAAATCCAAWGHPAELMAGLAVVLLCTRLPNHLLAVAAACAATSGICCSQLQLRVLLSSLWLLHHWLVPAGKGRHRQPAAQTVQEQALLLLGTPWSI